MSAAGEKVSLDQFVSETEGAVRARILAGIERIQSTAEYLLRHSRGQTEISVQLEQLITLIKPGLETGDQETRGRIAHEAEALRTDLKQRWISAQNPPLVDEIDTRLNDITIGLEALKSPDTTGLRKIARQIDGLAEQAERFGGIEQRFIRLAMGAAVLFGIGLILLIFPRTFDGTPFLSSIWTIIGCMLAFPAVAVFYAYKVLPRSRLDAEIEALNQRHFVPLGGVYFAAGIAPAGVIRVTYTPPEDDASEVKDPRKEKHRIGPMW